MRADIALQRGFGARLADTTVTFARELRARGAPTRQRLHRVVAAVLAGMTQFLDRARVLVVLIPLAFDRALSWSATQGMGGLGTAAVAALAVGTMFFVWGVVVGRSFQWSLDAFPATTRAFLTNHPAVVGVISSAIDGFPRTDSAAGEHERTPDDTAIRSGPYATRCTLVGKAALAVTRGLKTALIFGTTAHVGMATVTGFDRRSVRRRTLVVATEAAAVLGVIAALVSTLLTHDLFGVAERVRDTITDRRVLLGATVVIIVAATVDNAVRRRRFVDGRESVGAPTAPTD